MTDLYSYWKSALAGEKPKMFVDDPQCGFYRKGIYERNDKGNKRRTGWEPVAVFMAGETMTGRTVLRDVTGDALNELWSYIAGNPISEEAYRAVAERGERWPDDPLPPEIPAADRDVTTADNAAPKVMTADDHAAAIDNAIGAAPNAVASEAEAAQALGFKNRIAELRLDADKAGKADYQPPFAEYKRLYKIWVPMIERAEQKEKQINTAILKFREAERQRIAKEQAAAEAKQREIEAANAKLETPLPVPEVAPSVAPAPILPTYGKKKLREEVKKFAIINDRVAALTHFKDDAELLARLDKLCTDAVRAGMAIPGVTYREGLL
jgi:hypothetical protein